MPPFRHTQQLTCSTPKRINQNVSRATPQSKHCENLMRRGLSGDLVDGREMQTIRRGHVPYKLPAAAAATFRNDKSRFIGVSVLGGGRPPHSDAWPPLPPQPDMNE